MLLVILLSVIGFLSTSLRNCRWTSAPKGTDYEAQAVELDSPMLRRVCDPTGQEEPWNLTELLCIAIFTAEFAVRFLAAGQPQAPHPPLRLTPAPYLILLLLVRRMPCHRC